MNAHIQDAYVVSAVRTPVGKAPRGAFRTTRPDDLLAHVIRGALNQCPQIEPSRIGDVIVGCAMPEAEQGMNVARIGVLLAGLPDTVPGVTVNRFCSSGLQAISMAADRIRLGEAEVMMAAGTESMSLIPMGGHRMSLNPAVFTDENIGIAFGMGITAEKVAEQWQIDREDQDAFALQSHQRATAAKAEGSFDREILPYSADVAEPILETGEVLHKTNEIRDDEGPRSDTSMDALAKLRPVFAARGTVTAGNSSQMSDGSGAAILVSEKVLRELDLTPLARFMGYAVAGVPPEIMGVGPKEAIPKVLSQVGLKLEDVDWIELNEAFAAQSLAVIRTLGIDPEKVNPQGSAIALGHPLGATGAIRTATLVHGMRRTGKKYGIVTMCIGTGMGAAGVFEAL